MFITGGPDCTSKSGGGPSVEQLKLHFSKISTAGSQLGHRVNQNITLFGHFPIENYACPEVLRTLISLGQNDQHICIQEVEFKNEIQCNAMQCAFIRFSTLAFSQ